MTDTIEQVKELFSDDVDLLEHVDWNEADLKAGIKRRLSHEHGTESDGPITAAADEIGSQARRMLTP